MSSKSRGYFADVTDRITETQSYGTWVQDSQYIRRGLGQLKALTV